MGKEKVRRSFVAFLFMCVLSFVTRFVYAQPMTVRVEEVRATSHASLGSYVCASQNLRGDRLCRGKTESLGTLIRRTQRAERRFNRPLLQTLLAVLCLNGGHTSALSLQYKAGGRLHERSLPAREGELEDWLTRPSAETLARLRALGPSRLPVDRVWILVRAGRGLQLPRFTSAPDAPSVTLGPPTRGTALPPVLARTIRPRVTLPVVVHPVTGGRGQSGFRDWIAASRLLWGRLPESQKTFGFLMLLVSAFLAGHVRGYRRGQVRGRARARAIMATRVENVLTSNGLSSPDAWGAEAVYRTPPRPDLGQIEVTEPSRDTLSDPNLTPHFDYSVFHAKTPAHGMALGAPGIRADTVKSLRDTPPERRSLLPPGVRRELDHLDALAREVARLCRGLLSEDDSRRVFLKDPSLSATDVLRLLLDILAVNGEAASFFVPAKAKVEASSLPAEARGTYAHRHITEEVVVLAPAPASSASFLTTQAREWPSRYGTNAKIPVSVRTLLGRLAHASPDRQSDLAARALSALLRHVTEGNAPEAVKP